MTPKEFLTDYNIRMSEIAGFEYGESDEDLRATLLTAERVHYMAGDQHRWWTEYDVVVQIENRYIHYITARTTTDMSAEEAGWEWDWDTVYFCEPQEVTITTYKRLE